MTRTLATAGTVLLLAVLVTGCGGEDTAKKSSSPTSSAGPIETPTDLPTALPSCLRSELPTALPTSPTEVPSDLAGCLPSNPPTEVTTEAPTEASTASATQASGGSVDACAVVTAALIKADFGAESGQALGQPSTFGDPNAKDCYYVGGDVTFVVQATTRADQDMPEGSYNYQGLPGAEVVSGADRGWAYVLPGQSASAVTSALILVKGQIGLNFTISVNNHPYTVETLQKFATDVLHAI